MKSINNFIGLALLSGALLTSCSDSFLQRDSLTESSSNTFWQTPDDALMALASCYDALQSNQLYNSDQYSLGPLYMDCISDNGGHFNWSGWMEGYDMAMGIHTPSSSIIGSYWKDCYEVISRCNVLIANIDRVDMDASQKAIYQAEAKTIRALMYINLTMTYQDVPFLTAPLTIDEAECEKTDRAAIVAHVMTDLQDAAEVLPQNASSRGHITKGAALSLLGRVALYNEKWDDAIAAYKQVQGLGYSLDPSYAKLFTQSGETSPEIIFAVRYEGPGMSEGAAFNAHWNTPLEAMNGTIDLADAYYCKDGKPTTDTKIAELNGGGGLDVSKPNPAHFENRDPRLYSTLFVPGMLWNGTVPVIGAEEYPACAFPDIRLPGLRNAEPLRQRLQNQARHGLFFRRIGKLSDFHKSPPSHGRRDPQVSQHGCADGHNGQRSAAQGLAPGPEGNDRKAGQGQTGKQ